MNAKLVVAVLFVLGGLAYLATNQPHGLGQFTRDDAISTARNDATGFLTASYGQAEQNIDVLSANFADGKWKVVMDVTINPHSYCPEVTRLSYEMFPIAFRNETIVSSRECYSRPITRKAEAIIDSYANSPKVRQLASSGYLACGFEYPITNAASESAYCYFIDAKAIASFATSKAIPAGDWIVQWTVPGKASYFVALDNSGTIVAQG